MNTIILIIAVKDIRAKGGGYVAHGGRDAVVSVFLAKNLTSVFTV